MFNYAKIITHDTNTTLNCVLLIAINNSILFQMKQPVIDFTDISLEMFLK